MSQKSTDTETLCTIDFKKAQVLARPDLENYYYGELVNGLWRSSKETVDSGELHAPGRLEV